MNLAVLAVIQARVGSTRLPGKVLMDICGKTMLERVIERVRQARWVGPLVIAAPSGDLEILKLVGKLGIKSYAGSELDVLDRFYRCTEGAFTIIRITADCPLMDPAVIDAAVQYYHVGEFDIVTNRPSYPDGQDCEVFSRAVLERVWTQAIEPYDREHVTSYIYEHPENFNIGRMRHDVDLSYLKWSVDTLEELEFVRKVYAELGEHFGLADLLSLYS